jgi:hypothetical protein
MRRGQIGFIVLAGMLINFFSLLIFCNSSIIPPQQKVPNVSNRGSQTIPSPLAFAEGLFYKLFTVKEGFSV